jgi:hypothetical protein
MNHLRHCACCHRHLSLPGRPRFLDIKSVAPWLRNASTNRHIWRSLRSNGHAVAVTGNPLRIDVA